MLHDCYLDPGGSSQKIYCSSIGRLDSRTSVYSSKEAYLQKLDKGFRSAGKFGPKFDLDGHLRIEGRETACEFSSPHKIKFDSNVIHGQLTGGKSVSLLKCITLSEISRYRAKDSDRKWDDNRTTIFPNLIAVGEDILDPGSTKIMNINFRLSDFDKIFSDWGITGVIRNSKDALLNLKDGGFLDNQGKKNIRKNSFLHFFNGKRQILNQLTEYGRVSAFHSPAYSAVPGPNEYSFKNHPTVRISFSDQIDIYHAMGRLETIRQLFQLIAGARQFYEFISVDCKVPGKKKYSVQVYDPNWPDPELTTRPKVSSADVLIRCAKEPAKLCEVLSSWIQRAGARQQSRGEFVGCFESYNRFNPTRLVAAANSFDLLPSADTGSSPQFSTEAINSYKGFRTAIDLIPDREERELLKARTAHTLAATLKSKIQYRAGIVEQRLSPRLDGLTAATSIAVNARNFFVHGTATKSKEKFFYKNYTQLVRLLEFVYVMSELIECGWDPVAWLKCGASHHEFGVFVHHFDYTKEQLGIQ